MVCVMLDAFGFLCGGIDSGHGHSRRLGRLAGGARTAARHILHDSSGGNLLWSYRLRSFCISTRSSPLRRLSFSAWAATSGSKDSGERMVARKCFSRTGRVRFEAYRLARSNLPLNSARYSLLIGSGTTLLAVRYSLKAAAASR